jgi:hypothetical protein
MNNIIESCLITCSSTISNTFFDDEATDDNANIIRWKLFVWIIVTWFSLGIWFCIVQDDLWFYGF